ncbi:MAG: FAD:protein FMN transferase [Pseudomonadota bacterium]
MLTRRTFIALPFVLAACKPGSSVLEFAGETMGTTYNVTVVDPDGSLDRTALDRAIATALAEVNAQMSNWDATSEVSRFNAAATTAPFAASSGLVEVIAAAETVRTATGGQFNIALGPLIELWGFGAGGQPGERPSDAAIANALAQVGTDAPVVADGGGVRKARPETEIFLSAIGKGHGVDRIARALSALGAQDYMVEIGGDLYAAGTNASGAPWQIGVETPDPLNRAVQEVVGVTGYGMATSGDYRNYFEVDGTRYTHILDAQTGRPITHRTASATVLTENAMLADAWATAMLVLGRERGMEIAEARALPVLFVDRTDAGFVATPSPAFATLAA